VFNGPTEHNTDEWIANSAYRHTLVLFYITYDGKSRDLLHIKVVFALAFFLA
jgi:hypothetical protein